MLEKVASAKRLKIKRKKKAMMEKNEMLQEKQAALKD